MTTKDYDVLWKENWGEMQELGPVHRHTIRTIAKAVCELDVTSVIDVGCGNGAVLEALQAIQQIEEVYGVDLSSAAIEVAQSRVKGTFHVMDFLTEGIDRKFDLVISSQVIEHIEDDNAFIERLRAITSKYCFVGTMQGRMRDSEQTIGHVRNYTREELEDKLARAGFSIERVIEWGFPFYSPLYRTVSEYLPGNHQKADFSRLDRVVASLLFQLYRLNSASHGDVIMILAKAT